MGWLGSNWLALVAVIVSLAALVLGRLDRRTTRRELEEQQARRVTMGVDEEWVQRSSHSHELEGWTLHIRNDSDLPVNVESLVFVWNDSWEYLLEHGRRELHVKPLDLIANYFLRPGEVWSHTFDVHQIGSASGFGDGNPDFALLTFRDQSDVWERRSDEPGALRRQRGGIRSWQKIVQWSWRRVPGFRTVVLRPIERRAIKSARKHGPDRMPRSLRLFRWLWGYWGAGERDPWLKPEGAPALWGFAELPWAKDDKPGDT